MDLAGDIMMPFLSPDLRITPAPEHRAIEILGHGGGCVVYIADIVVLTSEELDLAVSIEIGGEDPLATVADRAGQPSTA